MKKHIVCFGDSNTHGLCKDPLDSEDRGSRFTENERWTCLLQKKLGEEFHVVEEGLSGRTTCFDDPVKEGLCGLHYITPCLLSHGPVDLLIIMLGTNDSKDRFMASAACIALGMARLVKKAMATDCWGGKKPNILVISPLAIGEGIKESTSVATMGAGCVEKSEELAKYYEAQCKLLGVHFYDATQFGCEYNTIDFMHLTKRGHEKMAEGLYELIPSLL